MTETEQIYMTSNIDEVAYLVCRGAKINDYILANTGNWISFGLSNVKPEYRLSFGDVNDKTIGVPEFIAQRNVIKAKITELVKRPDKKPWRSQDSHLYFRFLIGPIYYARI